MGRDFRTDEKCHLFVEKVHCEDASEVRVLVSQHNDGTFQETEEASDERRPGLKSGRETLLLGGGGSEEGEDEFGYNECCCYDQTCL